MQGNLCDKVMKLDRNIRFVGIVNNKGEVIEGGFRQGVQPLLNGSLEQQMYVQSLANVLSLREFSDRLGMFRYSLTEHDNVTLITFPLDEGILCVSASPRADALKIRDRVLAIIKESKAVAKKKQKKV
jgi:hypothetical protein